MSTATKWFGELWVGADRQQRVAVPVGQVCVSCKRQIVSEAESGLVEWHAQRGFRPRHHRCTGAIDGPSAAA